MGDAKKFTGLNRILKSAFLQTMFDKRADGTFEEFLSDWKWIFSYSLRYKKAILFYLLMGIFSNSLSLVSSVVSKYLIDIIVGRELSQPDFHEDQHRRAQ